MRHALRNDELTLNYQPVADLATGRLLGVEALVRWRHPERGLLAPGAFLPAIEHTELMRELSRRVLAMAICQAGAWFRLIALGGSRPTCRPPTCSTARWSTTSPRCCAATARRPAGSRSRSPRASS